MPSRNRGTWRAAKPRTRMPVSLRPPEKSILTPGWVASAWAMSRLLLRRMSAARTTLSSAAVSRRPRTVISPSVKAGSAAAWGVFGLSAGLSANACGAKAAAKRAGRTGLGRGVGFMVVCKVWLRFGECNAVCAWLLSADGIRPSENRCVLTPVKFRFQTAFRFSDGFGCAVLHGG